jgi:hypothetical protein
LIWWGGALTAVGLVTLLVRIFDTRPAQARAESWLARRSAIGRGDEGANPGSRRARRVAGEHITVEGFDEAEDDAASDQEIDQAPPRDHAGTEAAAESADVMDPYDEIGGVGDDEPDSPWKPRTEES